jgi:uncharacterized protein YqjF (DUF2071 family)
MHAEPLDRISPTRRPAGPASGTQRWDDLLFVHWAFPVELVRALVPPAFELDLWDGRALVGLVPFRMNRIRSSWMPEDAALDFLETNVRTYVHRRGEPGVFFLSLEASSWLAVRVARLVWGLPYHHAEMSFERSAETQLRYRSRRRDGGARLDVAVNVYVELGPSQPGTLQHFVLERYYLFLERRGRVYKGHVHHPPYPARAAELTTVHDELLAAAGLPASSAEHVATHFSEGVSVEVFGPFAE